MRDDAAGESALVASEQAASAIVMLLGASVLLCSLARASPGSLARASWTGAAHWLGKDGAWTAAVERCADR